MRQAFAHDAVLAMTPEEDVRAPGGAVTVALCGDWAHEPPCPLAAHHTGVTRDGDQVRLRILFAAEPGDESVVRERIGAALGAGRLVTPEGATATWRLLDDAASPVAADETDHAARLTGS
ncbi:hypothetical protein [Actinocrispum wychmicini]|uniref:Uncharacterized protein n=1 Tax=Actinocrispum wychmicini TaxID=1213861 RepID=A0A4R2JLM4_9PSEU|nr:hypothetical protein [Actinocrispum wychmicini]TCO60941.1 hypothetical protein EV192_103523 [Actinocrispum wychmicini]